MRNGFLLKKEFDSDFEENAFVYFLLLSNVKTVGSNLISTFSVTYLKKTFGHLLPISDILLDLGKQSKIRIQEGKVIIGRKKGKHCVLLDEVTDTETRYIDTAIKYIEAKAALYADACRDGGYIADACSKFLIRCLNDPEDSIQSARSIVDYYSKFYQIVFQEKHRAFIGKEFGQAKTLLRLFSPSLCTLIIAQYFINLESYGSYPSFGTILFRKDRIVSEVKGLMKTKKSKQFYSKIDGDGEF